MSTVITQFNAANMPAVRAAIEKALAELNLGITVEVGHIRYTGDSFTCQLKGKAQGFAAKEAETTSLLLTMNANRIGIDHTIAVNVTGTGQCKIIGYNPRARTNPWIVRHPNGKEYVYPTAMIQKLWPAKQAQG